MVTVFIPFAKQGRGSKGSVMYHPRATHDILRRQGEGAVAVSLSPGGRGLRRGGI
jgi:hypothetical protein